MPRCEPTKVTSKCAQGWRFRRHTAAEWAVRSTGHADMRVSYHYSECHTEAPACDPAPTWRPCS